MPITPANMADRKATLREARAPQITRESTSRPYSSWPGCERDDNDAADDRAGQTQATDRARSHQPCRTRGSITA